MKILNENHQFRDIVSSLDKIRSRDTLSTMWEGLAANQNELFRMFFFQRLQYELYFEFGLFPNNHYDCN